MTASDDGLEPEGNGPNNEHRKGRRAARSPKLGITEDPRGVVPQDAATPVELDDAKSSKSLSEQASRRNEMYKPRLVVTAGEARADGGQESSLQSLPVPVTPASEEVVQLTEAQLLKEIDAVSIAIGEASDYLSLKALEDRAAVLKDMIRRMDLAFDAQNRFAELELRAARKLGQVLASQLHHGRPRKRYDGSTVSPEDDSQRLPKGLSGNRSSNCQRFAALPDPEFEAYIEGKKRQRKLISKRSLLLLCKQATPELSPPKPPKAKQTAAKPQIKVIDDSLWTPVWEAIITVVKVDLAIGLDPKLVKAPQGLDLAQVLPKKLKGNVLAKVDDRVEEWLNTLHEAKRADDVSRAILAFTATTGEPWFRLIDQQGWTCCFLRGNAVGPAIIAWQCDNPRPLAVALHRLGAVLRGYQAQDEVR